MTTVTENYRTNTTQDAMSAALDRIGFLAENGGSLKEIAREVKSVQDFMLAVTSAESDAEIEDLSARRNSI
jgi:hypothetical protein